MGEILDSEGDGGHGYVGNGVDMLLVEPPSGDGQANVRLQLVVGRDDLNRSPKNAAAGVADRQFRGND